jgi:hypothetical protein
MEYVVCGRRGRFFSATSIFLGRLLISNVHKQQRKAAAQGCYIYDFEKSKNLQK